MVTREQIDNFANEIARRYSPEKIILFARSSGHLKTPIIKQPHNSLR